MADSSKEKEALDRFLEEWDGHRARKSTLEAGLRDARETMKAGVALWLATLGYLIVAVARSTSRSSNASDSALRSSGPMLSRVGTRMRRRY